MLLQLVVLWNQLRDELEISDDHSQHIVEVVSDAAGELSDRLHLLGLSKAVLGLLQVGQVVQCREAVRQTARGVQCGA